MADPSRSENLHLSDLSSAARELAYERSTMLRRALEDGVPVTDLARAHQLAGPTGALPMGPWPSASPTRARLIAEALAFVRAARELVGVTRIALLGSLATAKPDPKDVDLLVAVADDADLGALATLGRRLQGHAQSLNRGGEVFLADSRGTYLGRLCPWTRCGPGIRLGCDALHCGRRPYLHDDVQAIRLAKSLVAAPPLEVWPRVVARVPLPEDVAEGLLAPLGRIMTEDGDEPGGGADAQGLHR